MTSSSENFLKKVVKTLDPKLEKYREKKPEEPKRIPAPKTEAELLDILRRTSQTILSPRQRKIIASAMTFSDAKVADVMLGKPAITFVKETEFLGPLTLDKLYKSGFSHFPVVDATGKIVGTLSIEKLTSLAIKEADRAFKYTDPEVFYVRNDYSLEEAFAAFLRTNSYFFIVIDRRGEVVGLLTTEMLISFLLGKAPKDSFDKDDSKEAVMKR
ncbi:CBS domain-containing protein [Candidatus Saccharibacteria bacterium]|nr:CBS domain-containing protein [Candidatus Saccharibacteria bacterium]